jgi:TRAP-type C4-dicarboxylate transport system permease small subunit
MSRINSILLAAACIFLSLTICIAVINMILRPLGHPITGSFELMGYGSAMVTALGLGFSQEKKCHIAVDILFKYFSRMWKRWLCLMGLLLSSCFFLAVSIRLFIFALDLRKNGELSETLMFPFYPVVIIVSLGLLVLSLNLLRDVVLIMKAGAEKR